MALNMNRLTEKTQEAIVAAQRDAEERRNTQLDPAHLLRALILQEEGIVPRLLQKLGVPPQKYFESPRVHSRGLGGELQVGFGEILESKAHASLRALESLPTRGRVHGGKIQAAGLALDSLGPLGIKGIAARRNRRNVRV